MKARFSRRNARAQKISSTKPCLRGGNIGSNSFLSSDSTFNDPNHAIIKQRKVSTSTPVTPPLIFIRSIVTIWESDSTINKTVRKIWRTEPRFVFTCLPSILLEYFRYMWHCTQPKKKTIRNKRDDVTVSSRQAFIPSSIQASVNSVPFLQYNIFVYNLAIENVSPDKS